MLKTIFLFPALAVISGVPFQADFDDQWSTFKDIYDRSYNSTEEEEARRLIFESNLLRILSHNSEADFKNRSYQLGINKFADWTPEEVSRLRGLKIAANRFGDLKCRTLTPSNNSYPQEIDWRKYGLVTAVKNQGSCGSCWAFSATGALEGQHKKKTGKLVSLSEQNLIDCSTNEGNQGCGGGYPISAFVYVKNNNGIDTEESYPYEEMDDECHFNSSNVGATITDCVELPQNDEDALMKAVATIGPISIVIDASHDDFNLYKSGIFNAPDCSPSIIDHAVLVVGYGSESGQDYWLVKNSWGTDWGEDGYIKIARNLNNECGVAFRPSYPVM